MTKEIFSKNPCEMCSSEGDDIIYNSIECKYQLRVETCEWDDYNDKFIDVYIDINFCPFCGRKLR